MKRAHDKLRNAFSLVEVVLALGVISFAIVAILGVFPVGLSTSHSAQDDTRAPQIAQMILSSLSAEASTQFNNVLIPLPANQTLAVDLTSSASPTTPSLYADNNGQLLTAAANATYSVTIITDNAPTGFDIGYANKVTVVIAWPANAAAANQTKRDYTRIISKY
jgi:uncharacterized protein (TIGR02598 family)